MDNIPSANMRQHKLDQQRKLIEEKQKQKRAMQNKKIELNDLKAGGGKSRPGSSNKRELHGYDGPLQYLSQGNPDSMTTVQVGWRYNFQKRKFDNFLEKYQKVLFNCTS